MTFFLYGAFFTLHGSIGVWGVPISVFDHFFDLHCTNHDFVARGGMWYLTVTYQSVGVIQVSGFSCRGG